MPTTLSIIVAGRCSDFVDPEEKFEKIMRGTQGALIVASTLQIVSGFNGLWRNVTGFMSPLFVVPWVTITSFGLYRFGFPRFSKCVEIVLPQLIILVICSPYIPHLMSGKRHILTALYCYTLGDYCVDLCLLTH